MPRRELQSEPTRDFTRLAQEREASAARRPGPAVDRDPGDCIPTGSVLLNLAASGLADGGWLKGTVVNVIGDSDAGKSVLALTCLAECAAAPRFRGWDLILDDAEESNEFPVADMFGPALASRLRSPHEKGRENSRTLEQFYHEMGRRLKGGRPFVYVLDSMDALDSRVDAAKREKEAGKREAGEKEAGSYGTARAKLNSDGLRQIKAEIKRTESLLIIVSQTRDQIGLSFAPKTRSGGKALKFYSCHELWLAVAKTLKRTAVGKERKCGVVSRIKVSKNHATGWHGTLDLPIYYGFGIDDIRACVQWMGAERGWTKDSDGRLRTPWGRLDPVDALKAARRDPAGLARAVAEHWRLIDLAVRLPGRYGGGAELPDVDEGDEGTDE